MDHLANISTFDALSNIANRSFSSVSNAGWWQGRSSTEGSPTTKIEVKEDGKVYLSGKYADGEELKFTPNAKTAITGALSDAAKALNKHPSELTGKEIKEALEADIKGFRDQFKDVQIGDYEIKDKGNQQTEQPEQESQEQSNDTTPSDTEKPNDQQNLGLENASNDELDFLKDELTTFGRILGTLGNRNGFKNCSALSTIKSQIDAFENAVKATLRSRGVNV